MTHQEEAAAPSAVLLGLFGGVWGFTASLAMHPDPAAHAFELSAQTSSSPSSYLVGAFARAG